MAYSHTLVRVMRITGPQGAIRIVRTYGGRDWLVPMPETLHDMHPLVVAVGEAGAKAISQEFGGAHIKLPGEVNALIQLRNHEILVRFNAEESISSIANDLQVDRKLVQKILDSFGARGKVERSTKEAIEESEDQLGLL